MKKPTVKIISLWAEPLHTEEFDIVRVGNRYFRTYGRKMSGDKDWSCLAEIDKKAFNRLLKYKKPLI